MNASSIKHPTAVLLCLWGTALCAIAQTSPPGTFTQVISTSNASVTVDFTLHPIRSANFGVIIQQADGSYATHVADVPRTYLGTVRGRPGAVAAGLLRANGTLWAQISMEDGSAWTTKGGLAQAMATGGSSPQWTTALAGAGGAGSNVVAVEVGIDATYNHYKACGNTPEGVLDSAEFSLMAANLAYLRDVGIEHQLGKLVVRASQTQDPYVPDGSDKSLLLQRVRSLWTAGNPMGTTHKQASVIHGGLNGGLAYGGSNGVIGTSLGYATVDSDSGDFWKVWRHEVGHNWGCSHTEGGSRTEGDTIMTGDNALSRFSSADVLKITSQRKSVVGLQNLGPYPLPLPPRVNLDTASFLRNTPVTMDVLANDSDSNGESLSLASTTITTNKGGTVTRLAGAGPGGRDLLQYTPPPAMATGTDWFRYRIQDSSGMQAVGFAMTRPRAASLNLSDHWRLDEKSQSVVLNRMRSSHNGTALNGALPGQPGAAPGTLGGMFFDGVDDRVSIPAPNYNTAALTITAWVKRNGNQNAWAPVVFSRSALALGLGFGDSNELRYHWSNIGYTWQPSPALVPPDGEWCLVGLSISPSGADLFLRDASGLRSARNNVPHYAWTVNSTMYLGHDPNDNTRHFSGWMDDVRVYTATLGAEDIESLYQQAINPPAITLATPAPGVVVPGVDVSVAATVSSQAELVDRVDFIENETILATAATAPYEAIVPTWEPGGRKLAARATYGDWTYQADSPPVDFTVVPPHPPVVSVSASDPASKWGPTPGTFTFTRDHGYGAITVSFSLGGNAVAGVDYQTFPASVSFAEGQLTQTLEVMPIKAPPDNNRESLTLTLSSGSGYDVGTSAATLIIDDHATYIWTKNANGSWDVVSNWNTDPNSPVFGPDTVVDFSQVNINANRDLNLGSAGKIVGRMLFGDKTTPSNQWDIVAQNGPLTLQTTTGQPIIEVKDWQSIITVKLAGTQGFEKRGPSMLRLNNTANDITGEIRVGQGMLQIRDGTTNTPAAFTSATMGQRSIRVTGTGVLDLPRFDATGTQNVTWTLPAITLESGGTLRFRNNNAATCNHAMNASITVGSEGGSISNNGGSSVQNITLGGALSGSGALSYSADSGTTRQLTISGINNAFGGHWWVSHAGGGTAILRAAAAGALGSGAVTVGNGGMLLNDSTAGLDWQSGVTLDGVNATLKLNQSWNNSAASLAMTGGTPLAEIGNAASVIGDLSGISDATLRGTGAASSLTVNQTNDREFAGTLGPNLQLIKSGPAGLVLSGPLDAGSRLAVSNGKLTLAGGPASIASLTQTGGDLALKLVDATTPALTIAGTYSYTGGSLRVSLPATGYVTGVPYPLVAYTGPLTGQPPVEFVEPAPAIVNYGSGNNSVITVTFSEAVWLTTASSPSEGGSVSGGGFHPPGSSAAITATPSPGWQFDGWEGEGVEDFETPSSSIVMNESKSVTAHFITDYQAWTRNHDLMDDDALPDADPDADGLINELEFRFGFDPKDPNSRLALSIRRGTGDDLILTINRVIPEGTFTLQSATSPAGPWDGGIQVPVAAPEWDRETIVPITGDSGFFRLRYQP